MSKINISIPAPAKINLFLHILGQQTNGYHSIQSVFQFISLHDTLHIKKLNTPTLKLDATLPDIPQDNNLILQAATLLQQHTHCTYGAEISLEKNIPIGGGLGGGSSDAASTLLALNTLWDLQLTLEELCMLGVQLGADIPIFIHGHACWAEGIGDKLTTITLPEPWYLLLLPNIHCSTSALFQDPQLHRSSSPLKRANYSPNQGHNDFEPLVRKLYPEIDLIMTRLSAYTTAKITGTGSTVYGTFDTREEASRIANLMSDHFKTMITKGLNQSPAHAKVAL